MSDHRNQDTKDKVAREAGFGAGFQAPLVRPDDTRAGASTQAALQHAQDPIAAVQKAADQKAADQKAADQRAARILVLATIAGAFVVAGGIEWAGWQIVYRHGDPSTVPAAGLLGAPSTQWALGMVRNASLALGVGIGVAAAVMILPWARKRPWRAAAATFALGTAAVLVGLAALTSWAP